MLDLEPSYVNRRYFDDRDGRDDGSGDAYDSGSDSGSNTRDIN